MKVKTKTIKNPSKLNFFSSENMIFCHSSLQCMLEFANEGAQLYDHFVRLAFKQLLYTYCRPIYVKFIAYACYQPGDLTLTRFICPLFDH